MTKANIDIEETLQPASRLLKCPEPLSLGDVAFYLEQKERVENITGIITASKLLESRNTDIGIIAGKFAGTTATDTVVFRSEVHTSELQSLMRTPYAGSCVKKNKNITELHTTIV